MKPDLWRVAWGKAVLAGCLSRQEKFEEARNLVTEAAPVIRAQRGEKGIEYATIQDVLQRLRQAAK